MNHIKIIKIALFCLISSFALASEESITTTALFTSTHELEREIKQTQQAFDSQLKQTKDIVTSLETPMDQYLDPQTLAEAEELNEWVKNNMLPNYIDECKKYSMKLKRLKNILNKKIELAAKEASTRRLEQSLAIAQSRNIARKLSFNDN